MARPPVRDRTYHIELKMFNVSDDKKFDAIKKAVARAARQLHAQAMLIAGNDTPPDILIYGEDFLNGKKEIQATTDDED